MQEALRADFDMLHAAHMATPGTPPPHSHATDDDADVSEKLASTVELLEAQLKETHATSEHYRTELADSQSRQSALQQQVVDLSSRLTRWLSDTRRAVTPISSPMMERGSPDVEQLRTRMHEMESRLSNMQRHLDKATARAAAADTMEAELVASRHQIEEYAQQITVLQAERDRAQHAVHAAREETEAVTQKLAQAQAAPRRTEEAGVGAAVAMFKQRCEDLRAQLDAAQQQALAARADADAAKTAQVAAEEALASAQGAAAATATAAALRSQDASAMEVRLTTLQSELSARESDVR
jgi:chromosome segregation ATPase